MRVKRLATLPRVAAMRRVVTLCALGVLVSLSTDGSAAADAKNWERLPIGWLGASSSEAEEKLCMARGWSIRRLSDTKWVCEGLIGFIVTTRSAEDQTIVRFGVAVAKDGVVEHEALAGIIESYGKPDTVAYLEGLGTAYSWLAGATTLFYYMGLANQPFQIYAAYSDQSP